MAARAVRKAMCLCCLLLAEIHARGICQECYNDARNGGWLERQFPRTTKPLRDTVEDWEILRDRGLSKREASVYMGYAPKTLERMLMRKETR